MSTTRKITIFTTKRTPVEIESSATVWGDLKEEVLNEGFDLTNLRPSESVNKTTLISNDAVLPEGEFVLFLQPIKTKAGLDLYSLSFRELRSMLTEDMKVFLSTFVDGKNWTQLSTSDLCRGIEAYNSQQESQTGNDTQSESVAVVEELTDLQKVKNAKQLLEEVKETTFEVSVEEDLEDALAYIEYAISNLMLNTQPSISTSELQRQYDELVNSMG